MQKKTAPSWCLLKAHTQVGDWQDHIGQLAARQIWRVIWRQEDKTHLGHLVEKKLPGTNKCHIPTCGIGQEGIMVPRTMLKISERGEQRKLDYTQDEESFTIPS